MLTLGAGATLANDYSIEYGIEAGYEYNDNINLSSINPTAVSGGRFSIPVTLVAENDRLEAMLAGGVTLYRFDEDAYDSDDYSIEGRVKYRFEYSELQGYAGYLRDSTRTSEFLDTGVVGLEATPREVASLGGAYSHLLSETNSLILELDYSAIDFESGLYQDTKFAEGRFGWGHRRNENLRLRLQGYLNRFENEGNIIQVETDSFGAEIGFDYEISEVLNAELLAGWVWFDSDYSTGLSAVSDESEADGLLLEASLNYLREYHEFGAEIQARPNPSGNGTLQYVRQIDLGYRYHLSERSSFDLSLILGQNESVDDRIENGRDYASVSLGLEYRLASNWLLSASYVHSYQKFDREGESADADGVYLTLAYRPEKSLWSR